MMGKTAIRNAMRRLSPQHRELIYRAHFLKQSIAEIAVELDITENAARTALHDAMQELRRNLSGVRLAV